MTWLPEFDDIMEIHFGLVKLFANDEDPISPPGPRDENLVHSACSRPNTGIGTQDKYSDDFEKIAALFHSLTQNHAFHNGNKRTALVSLLASLYRNGRTLDVSVSDDEIYELTVAVASGSFLHCPGRLSSDDAVDKIAYWLRRNSVSRNQSPTDMNVEDFVERCVVAGCYHREHAAVHHISRGENSIRIGSDTRKFPGAVARAYARRLGLSLAETGQTFYEFQSPDEAERDQIYRYMSVLRRLAKI